MTSLLPEPEAAMQSLNDRKIAGSLTEGSWRVDRPKYHQSLPLPQTLLLLIAWSAEMCQTRHRLSHMLS